MVSYRSQDEWRQVRLKRAQWVSTMMISCQAAFTLQLILTTTVHHITGPGSGHGAALSCSTSLALYAGPLQEEACILKNNFLTFNLYDVVYLSGKTDFDSYIKGTKFMVSLV